MAEALRLSPSGPDIANPGGAPFDPGTGARLRLAEASTTVDSTTNVITTLDKVIGVGLAVSPGVTPMVVSLDLPSQVKNYRAELNCDVMSSLTNADLTVTLTIESSPDGGTTWATIATNVHTLGFNAADTAAGDARQMSLTASIRSGTLFGVAADSTTLKVRGLIKASAVGAQLSHPTNVAETGDGSAHLTLEEMF